MTCVHNCSKSYIACGICGILALPSPLQTELFCQWLELTDLGRLDSAICNTTHRNAVLNLWKQEHCVLKPQVELLLGEYFAAWVGMRRLKIAKKLSVPEFVSETEAGRAFFEATGNYLPMLVYPGNFMFQKLNSAKSVKSLKSFIKRASTCANLQELIIARLNMNKVSLQPVLEKCTRLKTLRLMFAECLNYRELNKYGHYLESLEVVGFEGKVCPEEIPPDIDYRAFTKNVTLKKLSCMCLPMLFDRDRMATFACSYVGLEELNLDGFNVHHVFWFLESCTKLIALRVSVGGRDSALDDDEDVEQLVRGLQSMKYLHLAGAKFKDAWVLQLLRGCPQLRQFYLYEFQQGVDSIPEDLHADDSTGPGPLLSVLHVNTIHTDTLSEILRTYPHLTNVGIGRSTEESFDAALRVLSNYKVTELYLSVPGDYTYNNINLLPRGLTTLCLYNCKGLTNEHLLNIARNNPLLSKLHVGKAKVLTRAAVIELVKVCQNLTDLVVDDDRDSEEGDNIDDVLRCLCASLDTIKVCLKR